MSTEPASSAVGVVAPRRARAWPWFVAWALVGASFSVAVLGALTIGLFVLPVAAGATLVLVTRRGAPSGLPGLVSGLGLPLLWVAYLNRSGPGTVCTSAPDGASQCVDEWSPWPWVAVGLVLVVCGLVVFVRLRRR